MGKFHGDTINPIFSTIETIVKSPPGSWVATPASPRRWPQPCPRPELCQGDQGEAMKPWPKSVPNVWGYPWLSMVILFLTGLKSKNGWKNWWTKIDGKMKWMLDPEKTSLPWSGVAGRLSGNETGPGTQDWPSWKIKTARYALALRASVGKKNQTSRNQLWSKAPEGSQHFGCMLII
jgi:hypothetical protein